MSRKQKFLQVVLPIVILALGIIIAVGLWKMRAAPRKKAEVAAGPLVEVLTVAPVDHQVRVTGTGTVHPAVEIEVVPQVSGRVVDLAPEFVAGGFVKKGGLLFAIDKADYELAVERAGAGLAQAELNLAAAESKAKIARQEWKNLGGAQGEPNPLVLHQPQLKEARAGLAAAEAALREAELDLARTRILAPFNCRVRSEQVDIGQYVKSGNKVAVVSGTDRAEVVVPLPYAELRWLDIPRAGENRPGSRVTVRFREGGETMTWQGRIVRSLGEVDSQDRMARVVVAIDDPYGLDRNHGPRPALVPNMFVDVEISGHALKQVYELPRPALRENSTVWLMDRDRKLRIRKVTVARREQDVVLVRAGLNSGEQVVLTRLSGAADGLRLRTFETRGQP